MIEFTDADGVKQTLDTSKPFNVAYHVDCMELMKSLPDCFADVAVTDPPYGDGSSQIVQVERRQAQIPRKSEEPERQMDAVQQGSASEQTDSVKRTGGTWAAKYAKKNHSVGRSTRKRILR